MPSAPHARTQLLAAVADFRRALNDQFDTCRHADRYRPGLALRRLRFGVELLCRLQDEVLHPALAALRPDGWLALARAMDGVHSLRDLAVLGSRTSDTQQQAVVGLLEGVAQLHFAAVDDLLAEADAAAMPWALLACQASALLADWQAHRCGLEDAEQLVAA